MDNQKRGDASIDDILEELKSRGASSATDGKTQNVDAILAEMGLGGGKKPSPFDQVRPGAPVPPPKPRAAAPAPQPQPAPKPPVPEPEPEPEPILAPEPEPEPPMAEEAVVVEELEPEPEKPRRSKSGTMIWDIELEHTDVGPRVGKAAAFDKVDTDKYVGDSELNRWFDQDATMAFSKKERKQAEKEMRRRLAEEEREEKERRKGRGKKTQAPAPEEPPVEEEPVEEAAPYEEPVYEEEAFVAEEDTWAEEEPAPAPGGFEPPKDFDFHEKPQRKGLFARLFSKKEREPEDTYDDYDEYAEEENVEDDAFSAAFGDADAPRERAPEYEPEPEYEPAPAHQPVPEPPQADTAAFEAAYAPPKATKQAPAGEESAGVQADTAAFAAAYVQEEPEEDAPLQADTAAFEAAYQRPAKKAPQKTGSIPADTATFEAAMQPPEVEDAAQPEDAYRDAFAAALGKGKQPPAPQEESEAEEDAPTSSDPNTAEFAAALGKGPITRWPAEDKAKMDAPPPSEAWGGEDELTSQSAFDKTTVWNKPSTDWDEETSFFDMDSATTTFDAQIAERRTAAFAAIKIEDEQPGWKAKPKETESDTRNFDLGGEDEIERVPTAAFTQEFGAGDAVPDDRSLFLDDMVDDRFRQFFSETVVVGQAEEQQDTKSRSKRRKKTRSAILTGEFARMAEMAEQAELAELTGEALADEEGFDDYDRPQDAPAVEKDIASLRTTLTRRTVATAAIGVLLLWMGLSFGGTLPLPEAISFAAKPLVFTIIYLVLVMAAIVINFTTVATGLAGLFSAPTVDSAPALAALGGLLQGAMLLVQVINKQPAQATLFGGLAALVLCFNALGKRVRAVSILRNFQLASAGMDHSAAYILDSSNELSYNITKGLEEEDPTLLVSRPTALVKGFLRQSFSQRATDDTGRTLGWITLGAALAATALTLFMGDWNIFGAVSAFAAVLCIAAPFSSSLVSGVPSLLLQRSTARIGAVVPGWSAIEELGNVNVVMATSRDIFPPTSVSLKGIKTFEKERIDVGILYAASVLIEGCDTLRDIFSGVIQGKSDMLYKVESLVQEPGRGFTAWVQNNRVVIGSREMLQKHDVTPPPMELEVKYVPNGHMPVYLAVSGKLFAMFIIGYRADHEVRDTLNGLVKSGVSLLVHSDDMNVTGDLIEYAYKLPHGVVKVLGRRELEILGPLTTYTPESEGVMTHIGSFASFIGGMRYAAGCAYSERMSSIVQLASVILAGVLCLLLAFGGSLAGMSIGIALLYQAAWTLLVSIMPFMRRY